MIPAARLIVLERSGHWAGALRREWSELEDRLRETRHREGALELLQEAPASILLCEVTAANLEALAIWWSRLAIEFPRARLAIVADRQLADAESFWRELGAVAYVHSARQLAGAARVIRRHLSRYPSPDRTWRETLFDRLPWPRHASP